MTVNPICIIRGLCNNIQVLVCYEIAEWLNPKLWSNGYFSIYLLRDNVFGHKYIEVLAEALAEYERDRELPNGTFSLQLYTRFEEKSLKTYFELCGPFSPDIRSLSKYLFKVSKDWGYEPNEDCFSWVDEEGEEYAETERWKYIVDVEEPISENAECEIQTRLDV